MATVSLYAPTNMDVNTAMPSGSIFIIIANANLITISVGEFLVPLYGSYQYNPLGQITSGAINGFDVVFGLNRLSSIRGLSIDVTSLATDPAAFTDAILFSGNDIFKGSSGSDLLRGYNGNDFLYGMAGHDVLLGEIGNDTLTGGAGNDILDGGAGADNMIGGSGNDTYYVDDIGDVVTEASAQLTQIDRIFSSISYALANNIEILELTGTAAIDGAGNDLNNTIIGNNAANVLDGGNGNDSLNGGGGNDTLSGGAGNDILDGGTGADIMAGGIGNDTYHIDDIGDIVNETSSLPTEIDSVFSSISHGLGSNIENLTLTGTDAINGTGNVQNNRITGNGAANILDGGAGADRMTGGLGNDTYYVDDVGDVVFETSMLASEMDRVFSSVTYTLRNNIEDLTLTGAASINGTGNALNNIISGNDAANRLNGGAGDDSLIGGAGNDILIGGLGIDTFAGGAGDDTYVVNDTPPATVLNITGQAGNYVSGGAQNYTYTSAAGTWTVGQLFDRTGDGLIDYLYIGYYNPASSTYERCSLTIGSNQLGTNLAPGTYLNAQRAVVASPGYAGLDFDLNGRGNNQVVGSFTIDSINIDYSGATPQLLSLSISFAESGYLAEPQLTGSLRYNIPAITLGELVTEHANEGTDHVISSVSYALSANVENLTLSGNAALNGTGNALDNILVGNGAANTLTGQDGKDTLTGNAGTDTFDFNALADSVVGINRDVITDFVHGVDKIDLADIDAIAGGANNAFAFIGAANFSAAGQVRFANGILYGNTNADLAADFEIALTGVTTLTATDFVL